MVLSLRVSLEALLDKLWQVQGGAGREPAAGVRISEKAEYRHRGDRKETFRDSQWEFAAIHCENCRMENKVRRKDGHSGEGRDLFSNSLSCVPQKFSFSLL